MDAEASSGMMIALHVVQIPMRMVESAIRNLQKSDN
jgi:hypothetical protein